MDEAGMPMCFRVLLPHMKRAAREAYVQKMALEPCPFLPDVIECGYNIDSDGELKIRWVSNSAYPSFVTVEEDKQEDDDKQSDDGKQTDDESTDDSDSEQDSQDSDSGQEDIDE